MKRCGNISESYVGNFLRSVNEVGRDQGEGRDDSETFLIR